MKDTILHFWVSDFFVQLLALGLCVIFDLSADFPGQLTVYNMAWLGPSPSSSF